MIAEKDNYRKLTVTRTRILPPRRMGLAAERKLLRWMGLPSGIATLNRKLGQPQMSSPDGLRVNLNGVAAALDIESHAGSWPAPLTDATASS